MGHVFQGRFKAVVAQRESYLLELSRYVVLNPVRAGLCVLPQDWPWSSYHATVGTAPAPEWLNTQWLLSQFGNQPGPALAAYVDHVRAGIGLPSEWDALKNQLYLGDTVFAQGLQLRIQHQAHDFEIPRSQRRSAAPAPALTHFTNLPERNTAMVRAYAGGRACAPSA